MFARYVVASWIAISTVSAQGAEYGNALYTDCTGNKSEQISCMSYMLGVHDGLIVSGNTKHDPIICIASGKVNGEQLRLIFVRWAERNPEYLNRDRGYVVVASLRSAFPCRR